MLKLTPTVLALSLSLSGCQLIEDHLDGNQPPTIGEFSAEPAEGPAPLLVGFDWEAVDLEEDILSCTLVFADGAEESIENCAEVTNAFYTFETTGGYTVVLKVDDGLNTVAASAPVRVLEVEIEGSPALKPQKLLPPHSE